MSQVIKLDSDGLDLVQQILENHLSSEEKFSYSIVVNKHPVAFISKATTITPFEKFRNAMPANTKVVDVVCRFGDSTGGPRLTLAAEELGDVDIDPNQPLRRNKYNNAQKLSREEEIEERAELRVLNGVLEKENARLTNEIGELRLQAEKAKAFESEVDKLLEGMRNNPAKSEGMLDQLAGFVQKVTKLAPGLLKHGPLAQILGPGDTAGADHAEVDDSLGGTTIKRKGAPVEEPREPQRPEYDDETLQLAQTMRELKRHFSEYELKACFHLLALLSRGKQLIPVVIEMVTEEVQAQRPQQRKQQTQQPKPSAPAPEQMREEQQDQEQHEDADSYDDKPPIDVQ